MSDERISHPFFSDLALAIADAIPPGCDRGAVRAVLSAMLVSDCAGSGMSRDEFLTMMSRDWSSWKLEAIAAFEAAPAMGNA